MRDRIIRFDGGSTGFTEGRIVGDHFYQLGNGERYAIVGARRADALSTTPPGFLVLQSAGEAYVFEVVWCGLDLDKAVDYLARRLGFEVNMTEPLVPLAPKENWTPPAGWGAF